MLKYAILGFGGLGKLHYTVLKELERGGEDIRCVAIFGDRPKEMVCTINIGRIDLSEMELDKVKFYDDYKRLINEEKPDFVISALPTFLHEEAALYAMSSGCHLLSEKPMALTEEACKNMLEAADNNQVKLMIGQCLRFEPCYRALKKLILSKRFGSLYRAEFSRYSSLPGWSVNNWILKKQTSGGCALDMHVHDVDVIRWMLGMPVSVHSVMTEKRADREAILTQYVYPDAIVTSAADWSLAATFPFESRCMLNFEGATVVLKDGAITAYTDEGVLSIETEGDPFFTAELKAFLSLVKGAPHDENTDPRSAADSIAIALCEIRSAEAGKTVYLN